MKGLNLKSTLVFSVTEVPKRRVAYDVTCNNCN